AHDAVLNQNRSVNKSHRQYANPRNQRIKHEDEWTRKLRSDREDAGLMKQHPQFRSPTWHRTLRPLPRRHWKSIEIVVNENHQHAERSNDWQREMNERREHDHRESDHPNHLQQKQESGVKIKERGGAYDGDFQKDKP